MRPVSVGTILVPEIKTTVYTVPVGYYALWNLCYVVNTSGNNKFIDVIWHDASTNIETHVLDNYILSPTQFIKFDGGAYIVLILQELRWEGDRRSGNPGNPLFSGEDSPPHTMDSGGWAERERLTNIEGYKRQRRQDVKRGQARLGNSCGWTMVRDE